MIEMTTLTSPNEFENFLKLLPQTPIFIPIIANDKKPEVSAGESWKDIKYHLTPEQAIIRLCEGKNVGVVANDWLVIVDLDNPDKYKLNIKTLTIKTRNGKLHMYYKNAGDIENSVGKNTLAKCGEVRAEWQYVLAPGSYVPTDENKSEQGTGLYHIIDSSQLATLHKKDLPEDFIPTTENTEINPEVLNKEFSNRNKYGWTIEDIRERDKKLDELLNNNLAGLPSNSEADMSTLTKLLYWEFDEGESVAILKKYRQRPKLNRASYITNMLGRINRKDKISDKIDPKKWNPKTGYMIEINCGEQTATATVNSAKNITEFITNIYKQKYTFRTPTDTEDLYFYQDGIYKQAEHIIKKEVEDEIGAKISTHYVSEVIEHLKWSSFVDREQFNKYNGYVPVENGLLELDTLTLKPFNPDQIFTFKLPIKYDKEADCPQFKQWLTEVQSDDNIKILQEYAGYCLLPKMPFHKSIWFIGEGRNGKTTYMNTIESIIDKSNVAKVPLQSLNGERNFIEYELYGKLVNVASEPTTKKELETPLFKKLTGDDPIAAEVKLKQNRVYFTNFAKFYIIGNKYPRVRDNTIAFKERIIIIKWESQFIEGKNQIQHIQNRWLNKSEERSGILNWMLEGLHRLISNGKFSMTKTQEEYMIEFERASDSIAAWIHERLTFKLNGFIERESIMEDYMEYCDYYSIYQANKKTVFDRLRNTPKIKDTSTRILGKKVRGWSGIELKPSLNSDDSTESGTLGTVGTCKKQLEKNEDNSLNLTEFQNTVPTAPTVPKSQPRDALSVASELKVCGNCENHLKPSCQYPGDFDRVPEDSSWAYNCVGFKFAMKPSEDH